MIKAILSIAVLGATSVPAVAREWPSAGGWDIEEGVTWCTMAATYTGNGSTVLGVSTRPDHNIILTVANRGWSVVDDQIYDLTIELDGAAYEVRALGVRTQGNVRGLSALLPAQFLDRLAKSDGISFKMAGTTVDNLSLSGSALGVAQLKKCAVYLARENEAEAREQSRFAYIPVDPFPPRSTSATPDPAPMVSNGPRILLDQKGRNLSLVPIEQSEWLGPADYPPRALQERRSGWTTIVYSVTSNGRVRGCKVTQSSGSSDFDKVACQRVAKSARYQPFEGSPKSDMRTLKFEFTPNQPAPIAFTPLPQIK